MIRRTLLEWERIAYGDTETTIPELHAARLAAVAQASVFSGRGGGGVLDHGRKDLRARGVVGVIATPGSQLEILPKIERAGEDDTADTATLRHRLIHMLAVAQDIRIEAGALANLAWQKDTLLEILIRLFCGKLIAAVRQGMPRSYVNFEDDLPALRGRLDSIRQFSRFAARPNKLACRFDALSTDTPLNQVMKATVVRLARFAQAADNQASLRELAFAYADITEIDPPELRWEMITLDRTNDRWRELLSLARLLLGNRHQQTSAGSVDGHALLFEMNVLFEKYVEKLLKRGLVNSGLVVSSQGGHRDCLYEGETGRFRTRPDLIVRRGNEIVVIVDTKWKRITSRIDDPKQGVSQADVYQLMAYSQIYDCKRTMLLYPHHHELGSAEQRRDYAIAAEDSDRALIVATIDVGVSQSVARASLANLIIESLPENIGSTVA